MKKDPRTLYDLSADLERLSWILQESGGEITEIIDGFLTDTERAVQDKVADYVGLILNLEGLAELKKAEAERLSKSRKADTAIADKLRARLAWFFADRGLTGMRTARGTVTRSKSPPKKNPELIGISDKQVPTEYLKEKVVYEPDYERIRADLEAGVELKWARLPGEAFHISIR